MVSLFEEDQAILIQGPNSSFINHYLKLCAYVFTASAIIAVPMMICQYLGDHFDHTRTGQILLETGHNILVGGMLVLGPGSNLLWGWIFVVGPASEGTWGAILTLPIYAPIVLTICAIPLFVVAGVIVWVYHWKFSGRWLLWAVKFAVIALLWIGSGGISWAFWWSVASNF